MNSLSSAACCCQVRWLETQRDAVSPIRLRCFLSRYSISSASTISSTLLLPQPVVSVPAMPVTGFWSRSATQLSSVIRSFIPVLFPTMTGTPQRHRFLDWQVRARFHAGGLQGDIHLAKDRRHQLVRDGEDLDHLTRIDAVVDRPFLDFRGPAFVEFERRIEFSRYPAPSRSHGECHAVTRMVFGCRFENSLKASSMRSWLFRLCTLPPENT